MSAWTVYYVPMNTTRKGDEFLTIAGTFNWSKLFRGLSYDTESHEVRMPVSLVGEQVSGTVFGTAWRLAGKRTLMFVRADPVTHGFRLCFASRDKGVVARLQSRGMTPVWYPTVN